MSDLPAPLTPKDCDLRDYPWMPLDVRRLLTSETWVLGTPEEKVASMTLWCESWCQVPAGSLSADDRMLAHLSGSGANWQRVREHVMRGWVKCDDGRVYHPVVAEKAREAWERKLAQRGRTEAARKAKAGKRASATDACPQGSQTDVTEPVAASVTETVTASVTEAVTGSTVPDQTRTREERSLPSVVAPVAPPEPRSARDTLWQDGIPILSHLTGQSQVKLRPQIGRWLSRLGDDCPRLMLILQEAREARPVDPIAWIERAVGNGAGPPYRRPGGGGRPDPAMSEDWQRLDKALGIEQAEAFP